jgi:hypothetical protein
VSGRFGDTVYVTTSPYVSVVAGNAFHEIVEVWKTEFDEDQPMFPPGADATAARRAHEECPDKRIIVHFIQPQCSLIAADRLDYERAPGEGDW